MCIAFPSRVRDGRRPALGSLRPVRPAIPNGTFRFGGVVVTFADRTDYRGIESYRAAIADRGPGLYD